MGMERRLWLLDVATEVEEGQPVVWLWCKDEPGLTKVVKKRYNPSFYLLSENLEEGERVLRGQGVEPERVKRLLRGKPVEALRIQLDAENLEHMAHKLVKNLRDAELYEEDIRVSTKFLLELSLRPSSWILLRGRERKEKETDLIEAEEIKMGEEAASPNLRVLAIDPLYLSERGSPKPERDPVILISIVTSEGQKTQLEGGEKKILEEFLRFVREYDPDVLVGFGLNRLHWNYLMERAKRSGLRLEVGRLGSEPHTSIYGHVSIRGRLNIDLEDMARDTPELTVETLEEFAEYLGIRHRFDVVEEWELAKKWRETPDMVKRYSMQRAETILKCYEALRDFIFSLSELTGMPADYVLTASTGFRVENYLMYLAVRRGELIPKRREERHVSYSGGLVKAPKPGLHEDVAVVDFRSMYPSLMIKYNISFDTLSEEGENVAPNGYRFKAAPEGFLPHALRTLLEERRRIQGRLREVERDSVEARVLDARQRAVKLIANAIYGYTGWMGARWYSREVAEATTAWGRQVITEAMKKAEELGMQVIYSDTDSLFLQNHRNKLDKLLKWIEEDLRLEAKVEKIYKRIIFTEAKKKYAGIDEERRLEIVGLEAVRGDWSRIAREAQRETVRTLLETGSPSEALQAARRYIKKIMRREVEPRKLILWRQITRSLDEYEATQPHIVVARQLVQGGWRIQPGDKVGYLIVQGKGPLYTRAKPYFEVKKDEIDWEYYLEKQVSAACMRVLSVVGVKPGELRKVGVSTSLTDFL